MNWCGHKFKKGLFLYLPNNLGTHKELTIGYSPAKAMIEQTIFGAPIKYSDMIRMHESIFEDPFCREPEHDHVTPSGSRFCKAMQ